MSEFLSGAAIGIVADNRDPYARGRVKVRLPDLEDFMTPYWVMPAGVDVGGDGESDGSGSQARAPRIGAQVAVIWVYGDYQRPDALAIWLGLMHPTRKDGTGASAGPAFVSEATSAERMRKRAALYESAKYRIAVCEEATDSSYILLQDKKRGTKIEINGGDGTGGKSSTIRIEAVSGISIYSTGPINIDSDIQVSIQGRKVNPFSEGDI